MEAAALAKFFGCSPVHLRGMTLAEIEAARRLVEIAAKQK